MECVHTALKYKQPCQLEHHRACLSLIFTDNRQASTEVSTTEVGTTGASAVSKGFICSGQKNAAYSNAYHRSLRVFSELVSHSCRSPLSTHLLEPF